MAKSAASHGDSFNALPRLCGHSLTSTIPPNAQLIRHLAPECSAMRARWADAALRCATSTPDRLLAVRSLRVCAVIVLT